MAKFTRVFSVGKLRVDFVRGLRFRLAVSYVILFAAMLVVIGVVFRENLRNDVVSDVRATLDDDWGAIRGYLHIDNERPEWIYDRDDPEENFTVERLRRVYLLTDADGNVLERSDTYASIGVDSPEAIRRILSLPKAEIQVSRDKSGTPYLIEAGSILDSHKDQYFLAIGRSLALPYRTVDSFTRMYLWLAPAMLALASAFGWWLAGGAIRPVNDVAHTAQSITGSNLTLKIPLRGAGDELDHLIDSFNRMTERLHQSFEQIRRFSTDVSHELRTPLTAIRGQLEVALFTAERPEQYREAVINALEDVEHLSNIVRALLLLSQAESGQLALQKAPLDLGAVAAGAMEQFQFAAEEKKVRLSASLAPGVVVPGDRTQIDRLISNLLSNAVKYTPEGGSVRIAVASTEEGWARLVVDDTGPGIPAEYLPQIFDRFYRVPHAQRDGVEGLGLGLSFVAWIVEAHGGRIDVASTVGEGCRFTVLLPIEEATAETAAEANAYTEKTP